MDNDSDNSSHPKAYRKKRVKLIFNPQAGAMRTTDITLEDVVKELQAWNFVPEAYLVEPESNLAEVVKDAIQRGFRMFVVCGGDGTISTTARSLAGTRVYPGACPYWYAK